MTRMYFVKEIDVRVVPQIADQSKNEGRFDILTVMCSMYMYCGLTHVWPSQAVDAHEGIFAL